MAYMEKSWPSSWNSNGNFCAEYTWKVQSQDKDISNGGRKWSLWDFQIRIEKVPIANQPDLVVVNKVKKKAGVIVVAIPSDSNVRKKEH